MAGGIERGGPGVRVVDVSPDLLGGCFPAGGFVDVARGKGKESPDAFDTVILLEDEAGIFGAGGSVDGSVVAGAIQESGHELAKCGELGWCRFHGGVLGGD